MFWNLATNGLKSMPGGGTLTIEVEDDRTTDQITIRFADEGVGMDSRQQERYFQPFSGSFEEGTGLGAAIVYRLVEEHGGKIQLRSSPGNGTRVSIAVPRWCARPEARFGLRAAGG